MTKYRRVDPLQPDEMETFTRTLACYQPPITPTGEVIEVSSTSDPTIINKVVIQGSWTPYGFIRDCGDHYIIAKYSRYDRISKDLQTITEDTEDR